MIERTIRAATCRVSCGDESGTGWLITPNLVITARHCVLAGVTEGKSIELFFPENVGAAVSCEIVGQSEEHDVCLLSIQVETLADSLPVSFERPREGEGWQTFGYPAGKIALGHRLFGSVAQVLDPPKLKIDLDLSIDPTAVLQTYKGLSGGVVACEGFAVGLMRLKVDGTVAALSLYQLKSFLADNGVTVLDESSKPGSRLLADREAFTRTFTEAVQTRPGNYFFLEGAHGYGKSTFCANFQSNDKTLINVGAYCLSDPESALGADYRAQAQVFLDWLATTISGALGIQPPRKEERSYAEQIRLAAEYLEALSKHCVQTGRIGLLFVDGLNEISTGSLCFRRNCHRSFPWY